MPKFSKGPVIVPNLEVDHIKQWDAAQGVFVCIPTAATDEEKRATEAAAYRRSLESVRFRRQHLEDADHLGELPDSVWVARQRTSLDGEEALCLQKIAELEGPAPTSGRKPRRKLRGE